MSALSEDTLQRVRQFTLGIQIPGPFVIQYSVIL